MNALIDIISEKLIILSLLNIRFLVSIIQIFVLLGTSYFSSCSIHLILISRLLSGFFVTLSKRSFMASFYDLLALMPLLLIVIPIGEAILMIVVLPVQIQFILEVIQSLCPLKK